MPANLGNLAVATGLEKCQSIPIPKKGNVKECSEYHTLILVSHASKIMLIIFQTTAQLHSSPIALISHASIVMFKILLARLQQYVNGELPDVQAGFRKGRGISWRRQWHPTPVLLPGKSHGRSSLVGCSPWGR